MSTADFDQIIAGGMEHYELERLVADSETLESSYTATPINQAREHILNAYSELFLLDNATLLPKFSQAFDDEFTSGFMDFAGIDRGQPIMVRGGNLAIGYNESSRGPFFVDQEEKLFGHFNGLTTAHTYVIDEIPGEEPDIDLSKDLGCYLVMGLVSVEPLYGERRSIGSIAMVSMYSGRPQIYTVEYH